MKKLVMFLSLFVIPQSVFANIVCDNTNAYVAIYERLSISCNSGYFLPAASDTCSECPTNAICAGGEFDINQNMFQGLSIKNISNKMEKVCADNFPTSFVAIYEPNTINLQWYIDDQLITPTTDAQQCTYDGTIILPTPPTKPGYVFNGWRLRTNSNNP